MAVVCGAANAAEPVDPEEAQVRIDQYQSCIEAESNLEKNKASPSAQSVKTACADELDFVREALPPAVYGELINVTNSYIQSEFDS